MLRRARLNSELAGELQALDVENRLRTILPARALGDEIVEIGGKRAVSFCSWDLLGIASALSGSSELREAFAQACSISTSGRFVGGSSPEVIASEARLAKFFGSESALLFSSRNQAVLSLLSSLLGDQDLLVLDSSSTSPAVDAAYLAQAQVASYRWGNLTELEQVLEKHSATRRVVVVADSLCPLTGRLAPLQAISLACKRHDAFLVVDESFALGFLGIRGGGGAELAQIIAADCLAVCGDLSRGVASAGGFIATSALIAGYIANRSSTFQSDVGSPTPLVANQIHQSLDLIETAYGKRQQIELMGVEATRIAVELGLSIERSRGGPLLVVYFESFSKANQISKRLLSLGFLVDPLTVRGQTKMSGAVRILLSVNHKKEQVVAMLQALKAVS